MKSPFSQHKFTLLNRFWKHVNHCCKRFKKFQKTKTTCRVPGLNRQSKGNPAPVNALHLILFRDGMKELGSGTLDTKRLEERKEYVGHLRIGLLKIRISKISEPCIDIY